MGARVDTKDASSRSELLRRLIDHCYQVVLPGAEVGEAQDFFELGGDSLQLIKLVAAVQEEFGVSVDAARFFEEPTALRLLEEVEGCLSLDV